MPDLVAPPLALYVHLPWCVRKCPYCDFNSHVHKGELPEDAYVDALLADLDADLAAHLAGDTRRIDTVFLGGGTPSLFRPESLARLFEGLRARLAVAADVEVTMEANPGTVEHGRFDGYRDAGINRVSLGAQSFGAAQLAALGRIHAADDTTRAVTELRAAALHEFNLDLMYALPAQDLAGALADVDRALALGPTHLSHYQLTLEPGTVYYHRPPDLPDEDAAFEMQEATRARLVSAGFRQYEVSAWARPGHECRHNVNYWRYGDYLGIGAGAHGKLTDARRGTIVRTAKTKQPRDYQDRIAAREAAGTVEAIDASERPFEFMLNALRLVEGFELGDFERRTGVGAAALGPTLDRLGARGLLEPLDAGRRWRPTGLGLRFLNDLQAAFLPDALASAGAARGAHVVGT
jgi:putative oxygen-independent coproporphyrinogen III oxidase